jgi:biotin carboxyl carrier protein
VQPPIRIARWQRLTIAVLAVFVSAAGCGVADRDAFDPRAGAAENPTSSPSAAPMVTTAETSTDPAAADAPAPPAPRAARAPSRQAPRVQRHERAAFARSETVTFHLPSRRVERIGYHQSNHDGAQRLRPLDGPAPATVLGSRDRGTGRRSAADIVVHPRSLITAPVTGTVIAASRYVLYCVHRDDLVFIAPDERPDWIVKVLHIRGVEVSVGDRVEAGVTRIARRARALPFESQVDAVTASPPWPHVHVEMIDPSVPDRPTPGPGCP